MIISTAVLRELFRPVWQLWILSCVVFVKVVVSFTTRSGFTTPVAAPVQCDQALKPELWDSVRLTMVTPLMVDHLIVNGVEFGSLSVVHTHMRAIERTHARFFLVFSNSLTINCVKNRSLAEYSK